MRPVKSDNILWYDLRGIYHDKRIYPSQRTSILGNFKSRLFSQDRVNEKYPFPIRLIRSIFTNASKLSTVVTQRGEFNHDLLANAKHQKIKLENTIDTCVERILCYVAESDDGDDYKNEDAHLSTRIWAYPLTSIRKLGFHLSGGEIFIQLYRDTDNIRQLYSLNSATSCWEKVRDVERLSQLHLDHNPRMEDILRHSIPDLPAIRNITDMGVRIPELRATEYRKHLSLWLNLLPLLEDLLRDVINVLAQYNISLTLDTHNRSKG
ncbi:MAG: hypothetical protein K2H96_09670 [Muribaculaceae bacterium]|nr:hypothetical protein [Muribaculaceae bacterium]